MKLERVEITHVGRVRSENQDSIFSIPDHGVFMVADGMGGEKAGAEASRQVVASVERIMRDGLDNKKPEGPKSVEMLMTEAMQAANRDVFDISVREPDKAGLGSTGSLLLLHKGLYFAAQIGDSRIYLVRGGNVKQITRDQTVVWTLYESGVLTRDQLETHPERHLLTQCVGSSKPLEVDLFEGRAKPGDTFLICSDGLTGYAGEGEVIQILIDPVYTLEERGEKLLRAAMLGGGGDNVSVVLVKVIDLEPDDNWSPNEAQATSRLTPMPGKFIISDPPPAAGEPEAELTPSKQVPLLILAGLAAVLAIVVTVLALRPKTGVFTLECPAPYQLVETRVLDHEGKEVPGAIVSDDGKTLKVKLDRSQSYTILAHPKGAVPVAIPIEAGARPDQVIDIRARQAGTLVLEPLPEGVAELAIVQEKDGGKSEVYKWRAGEADIRLEHDLDPDFTHGVSATSTAVRQFNKRVQIPAGRSETVRVAF